MNRSHSHIFVLIMSSYRVGMAPDYCVSHGQFVTRKRHHIACRRCIPGDEANEHPLALLDILEHKYRRHSGHNLGLGLSLTAQRSRFVGGVRRLRILWRDHSCICGESKISVDILKSPDLTIPTILTS